MLPLKVSQHSLRKIVFSSFRVPMFLSFCENVCSWCLHEPCRGRLVMFVVFSIFLPLETLEACSKRKRGPSQQSSLHATGLCWSSEKGTLNSTCLNFKGSRKQRGRVSLKSPYLPYRPHPPEDIQLLWLPSPGVSLIRRGREGEGRNWCISQHGTAEFMLHPQPREFFSRLYYLFFRPIYLP